MVKWCVLYSSVTGNTRKLAQVAAETLEADLLNVNDLLGFLPSSPEMDGDLSDMGEPSGRSSVEIEARRRSMVISAEDLSEISARLDRYDCIMVGYWLRRGAPDQRMAALLPKISGKRVAFFQTHGAYEGSEHAVTAFARAGALLGPDNMVLGTFGCQAAVNPALIRRRLEGNVPGHRGEDLEDCKKRWAAAAGHPDADDLERMRGFTKRMQTLAEA